MARIYSNQGLIYNQNNSNSYMRMYSCGKNDNGPYLRLTIAASNPLIYITLKNYYSYIGSNSTDYYASASMITSASLYFDTGGNGSILYSTSYSILGANSPIEYTITTRQADVCMVSTTGSGGSSTAKGSLISQIFCNRWDYVTITQL